MPLKSQDEELQPVKTFAGTIGQRRVKVKGQADPTLELKVAKSREREESVEEKAGALHPKLKDKMGGALQTEKRRAAIERGMRFVDRGDK